jgi:hypothetical protein
MRVARSLTFWHGCDTSYHYQRKRHNEWELPFQYKYCTRIRVVTYKRGEIFCEYSYAALVKHATNENGDILIQCRALFQPAVYGIPMWSSSQVNQHSVSANPQDGASL